MASDNWDLLEQEARRRAGRLTTEERWKLLEGEAQKRGVNPVSRQLFEMLRNARTPEERKMIARRLVQNTQGGGQGFFNENPDLFGLSGPEKYMGPSVMPQAQPQPGRTLPPSFQNPQPQPQTLPVSPQAALPGAAPPGQPGRGGASLSHSPVGSPDPGLPRPAPQMQGPPNFKPRGPGAGPAIRGPMPPPTMNRRGMAGAGGPGLPPMQGPQQPRGMEAFWQSIAGLLDFGQPSGGKVIYPGQVDPNQFAQNRAMRGLL